MAVADDIVAVAFNCNLPCLRSLHHCWLAEKEVAYHRALQIAVHGWRSIISQCNIKKKNSRPARYALFKKVKCTIEDIYIMVHLVNLLAMHFEELLQLFLPGFYTSQYSSIHVEKYNSEHALYAVYIAMHCSNIVNITVHSESNLYAVCEFLDPNLALLAKQWFFHNSTINSKYIYLWIYIYIYSISIYNIFMLLLCSIYVLLPGELDMDLYLIISIFKWI